MHIYHFLLVYTEYFSNKLSKLGLSASLIIGLIS